MEINKDLIAASSTPMVLAILAEGDSYGYAIIQRVRELSGGHLEWTDGMLYPVLHRLERLGYVESTTGSRPGDGISSIMNAGSGRRWMARCGASGRRSPC
jgi:DNA-binding PadR family transcriptional regulator